MVELRNSLALRARRIIASMEKVTPISAAADPTVSIGASGAASTLNSRAVGNPLVPSTSAMIAATGGVLSAGSAPYSQNAGYANSGYANGLKGSGTGWGITIYTDAPDIDMSILAVGSIGLRINGQSTTDYATPGDFSTRHVKFAFGSAALRKLTFTFEYDMTFGGFNVAAGYRIWKALPEGPRGMIFGESYADDGWQASPTLGFASKLQDELGFELVRNGIAGQGVATTVAGKTFVDRANGGDFLTYGSNIDLLILYNSLNDYNKTAATVQTNWQNVIAKAMVDLPDALIYGFSGFTASAQAVDQSHNDAFVNAFNAVKDAARMRCDDLSAVQPLITTSGADRNDTTYLTGVHLTTSGGAAYGARRVRAGILDFVRSLA